MSREKKKEEEEEEEKRKKIPYIDIFCGIHAEEQLIILNT
jgi:hypothetical protein